MLKVTWMVGLRVGFRPRQSGSRAHFEPTRLYPPPLGRKPDARLGVEGRWGHIAEGGEK